MYKTIKRTLRFKMELIELEHKKQFEFIKKYNIKIGTEMLIKNFEGIKIIKIKWVTSNYGWFGEYAQIKLNDIIKINGVVVK